MPTLFKKVNLKAIILVLIFSFSAPLFAKNESSPPKKIIRILSIDGGGIRGIIPSIILAHIESRLISGLRLADCFDIISGTSTGGLIALMLSKPDGVGRPQYSASEISHIYENLGQDIFSQSVWQWIKSGNGWFGSKYSEKNLEDYLETYLGDVELKDCVTNVIVPAYEIELDKTFFFKSTRAKTEAHHNIHLKYLARATSAAPTYFRPANITDISGRSLILIDGGVGCNNPTLAAAVYAIEIFGKDIDFFIVSLGTGTNYGSQTKNIAREDVQSSGMLGWANRIIDVMMYAVNNITNYEMHYVFNHNQAKQYFRFQPILEVGQTGIDNTDPENIAALKRQAQNLILQNKEEIGEIVKILNTTRGGVRQAAVRDKVE